MFAKPARMLRSFTIASIAVTVPYLNGQNENSLRGPTSSSRNTSSSRGGWTKVYDTVLVWPGASTICDAVGLSCAAPQSCCFGAVGALGMHCDEPFVATGLRVSELLPYGESGGAAPA